MTGDVGDEDAEGAVLQFQEIVEIAGDVGSRRVDGRNFETGQVRIRARERRQLNGPRGGQLAVDRDEPLLRARGVLHRRDDHRQHQEEEAGWLTSESVRIANEVKVLIDHECGEDDCPDADEPPVAGVRRGPDEVQTEHGDQREDQRVDDRLQSVRRMHHEFERNAYSRASDECGNDDAMAGAPPLAAERLEQQRRGDGHEVLEYRADVGEPARMAGEQGKG